MRQTLTEASARFLKSPLEKVQILVSHHPVSVGVAAKRGWVGGLEKLSERIDLVLTGHLHVSTTEVVDKVGTVLIRAGTAISQRERGERNSYNLIRVKPGEVEVEVRTWNPATSEFESATKNTFPRGKRASAS